jgi:ligand-binding sensor domain-containing protein
MFVRLIFTVLLLGMACHPATAAPGYSVQHWEALPDSGLPQNTITAVVQTRSGYLWLGTYAGLARFDGVRFTPFDDSNTPGLANNRVTCLFEADDGTLWIGHETGNVTCYRSNRFETVKARADWSGGKIHDLASDEAGDLWLLNAAGLISRLRDGLVLAPESGNVPNVIALARSAAGTIWVSRNGRVSRLNKGKLIPLEFNEAGENSHVLGIGASRNDGL